MTELWKYRFIVGQWAAVVVIAMAWFTPWSLVAKVVTTLVLAAVLAVLAKQPDPVPSLEHLRKASIMVSSPEHAEACELVLNHIHEPILTVETRAEIQLHEMDILIPETGETAPCCEVFPHDLRITTGRQWGPLAGRGHTFALVVAGNGWEIVEEGEWIS